MAPELALCLVLAPILIGGLAGAAGAYALIKSLERRLRRQWRHTSPAGLRKVR